MPPDPHTDDVLWALWDAVCLVPEPPTFLALADYLTHVPHFPGLAETIQTYVAKTQWQEANPITVGMSPGEMLRVTQATIPYLVAHKLAIARLTAEVGVKHLLYRMENIRRRFLDELVVAERTNPGRKVNPRPWYQVENVFCPGGRDTGGLPISYDQVSLGGSVAAADHGLVFATFPNFALLERFYGGRYHSTSREEINSADISRRLSILRTILVHATVPYSSNANATNVDTKVKEFHADGKWPTPDPGCFVCEVEDWKMVPDPTYQSGFRRERVTLWYAVTVLDPEVAAHLPATPYAYHGIPLYRRERLTVLAQTCDAYARSMVQRIYRTGRLDICLSEP